MSFKVSRVNGKVVAYGPNDDNFEPSTPYEIEEEMPVLSPIVPRSVTMRQARLALLASGKLQNVINAINQMPGADGDAARIEWEYSSEVKRNQPLTVALAAVIGLSESQMDDLFIEAAKL